MEYSGWKICSDLKKGQGCFRLLQYDAHQPVEEFHEHVPQSRIKRDDVGSFLKTLLLRHSPLGDREVLRTFLNTRGKEPSAMQFCTSKTEYPEPGVLRTYLTTQNLVGWFDEVISPNEFRQKPNGPKG